MRNAFCFLLFFAFVAGLQAQGALSGTIIDESLGEPLIGANVQVDGTGIGTSTDYDGKYQFQLAPGTYTILVSYIGYQEKRITDVEIKDGEVTYLDASLSDDAVELDLEVTVTAKMIERTENALLLTRKNAEVVQDGISAQEFSRYSVSDAAGAMKKVTGATVEGGKYIYIRGLGDRYSLSQLNGLVLPSTDPYRNSAQLDLIPTNLLDNIITTKTFTPDQPGTFTGGNVDIKTKDFPETFSFTVGLSAGYNNQSNLRDDYLTHTGGNSDYFGFDDGTRDIPAALSDPRSRQWLNRTGEREARRNANVEAATSIDNASKSVIPEFEPSNISSPLDHSLSLSFGNQYEVFGNKTGILAALSFSQDYQQLNQYQEANYEVRDINSNSLFQIGDFITDQSTQNPTVNGLLGIAHKIGDFNTISFNAIYNHNTEKVSRFVTGERPDNIVAPRILQARQLSFVERQLINYQLGGEHVFPGMNNAKLEWRASLAQSSQYEPQTRFFENSYNLDTDSYNVGAAEIQLPFYFWRDLNDDQATGKLDFTLPLGNDRTKIKIGGLINRKDRVATEDRFRLQPTPFSDAFNGSPNDFVAPDNVGIINELDDGNYQIGNYILDETNPNNSYTGHEYVTAAYAMLSVGLTPRLKFVGGARMEITDILSEGGATNLPEEDRIGSIQETDILPSANLIYEIVEDMNLRASYSQTLARPNLREISPFFSIDPIIAAFFIGNTQLKKTDITNLDLRWEWFFKPGELIAVSGYYKDFTNPITLQFLRASNRELQFINTPSAQLYGIEFELRKDLAFLGPIFNNLRFNTNLSVITSTTDVDKTTEFDPDTRPFQGQPDFVANAALNYVGPEGNWDATLALNYIGDRLNAIGRDGTPDLYDIGRGQLDFTLIRKINNVNLKVSVLNILDDDYVQSTNFKGTDFIWTKFQRGVDFRFGISYTFR